MLIYAWHYHPTSKQSKQKVFLVSCFPFHLPGTANIIYFTNKNLSGLIASPVRGSVHRWSINAATEAFGFAG